MAEYNAKSSTRCSMLASTTTICIFFQSYGILSELSFRNFPDEDSARVHVSFQRVSLNFVFNFLETKAYTNKSEMISKADFYVEVSRRKMARIPLFTVSALETIYISSSFALRDISRFHKFIFFRFLFWELKKQIGRGVMAALLSRDSTPPAYRPRHNFMN